MNSFIAAIGKSHHLKFSNDQFVVINIGVEMSYMVFKIGIAEIGKMKNREAEPSRFFLYRKFLYMLCGSYPLRSKYRGMNHKCIPITHDDILVGYRGFDVCYCINIGNGEDNIRIG
jgi:hypothetical protein